MRSPVSAKQLPLLLGLAFSAEPACFGPKWGLKRGLFLGQKEQLLSSQSRASQRDTSWNSGSDLHSFLLWLRQLVHTTLYLLPASAMNHLKLVQLCGSHLPWPCSNEPQKRNVGALPFHTSKSSFKKWDGVDLRYIKAFLFAAGKLTEHLQKNNPAPPQRHVAQTHTCAFTLPRPWRADIAASVGRSRSNGMARVNQAGMWNLIRSMWKRPGLPFHLALVPRHPKGEHLHFD